LPFAKKYPAQNEWLTTESESPRVLWRLQPLRRWSHEQKSNRFSPEVRERAVRMAQENRGEYPSLWAAIESIALKIGCAPQTLHE
jgi:transposase-like protein